MVDLAMLQVVRDLVAIFGVIAGFTYYVMTVQSQRKNQKLNAIHNLMQKHQDTNFLQNWEEVINWEWVDYEDFHEKYWDHPETMAKFATVFNHYDGLGFLWKTGVIDLDAVGARYFGAWCLITWWKFKPIVVQFREDLYSDWVKNWEELSEELEKLIGDKIKRENLAQSPPSSVSDTN